MPANTKAKEIVHNLKDRLDGKKKTDIPIHLIELSEFDSPHKRTEFFTSLITRLPGFQLENVTSVKVESNIKEPDQEELQFEDDQETEQARQEMLALVKNVALKGQSLLASAEYQQLKAKGFYITSIIWRSRQTGFPYTIVECEAGFDEPETGKGFKYNVRGALHFQSGEYTKTLRPIPASEKQQFLSFIEQTSHQTLAELREQSEEPATLEDDDGGIS